MQNAELAMLEWMRESIGMTEDHTAYILSESVDISQILALGAAREFCFNHMQSADGYVGFLTAKGTQHSENQRFIGSFGCHTGITSTMLVLDEPN